MQAESRLGLSFARRWIASLSGVGLVLGTLFFAASLTPTLVPRTALTQGVLGGVCFAVGYLSGVSWRLLWAYLELPEPSPWARRVGNAVVAVLCLVLAGGALALTVSWQNSIRALMRMEPITAAHPAQICLIALVTFVVLLILGRLFVFAAGLLSRSAFAVVPRRVANVIGVVGAALLFWSLGNGVLARGALRIAESSYRQYDALVEPERAPPTDPMQAGSPASLVRWQELGRAGREFVASRPSADDIAGISGRPAKQPVRVYVGLRSADTAKARAQLALAELKRIGAFERSILVVITPTGTGWVDPSAIDAVEYLHGGDVASVVLQYSYLASPLSLLAEPENGSEAARALFAEVYDYWTNLPKERRPRLYLHGLSLGALNSQRSIDLFDLLGDPIGGALWSGPPFGSQMWRNFTDRRNAGSPAWLPEYKDGRLVRFMNQDGPTVPDDRPWGVMRLVYLQYASDAVTFFDFRDFYRAPAWLTPSRGPDVSPEFRWYPLVTALQIALDMAHATVPPMGHGHTYAPQHYVDAWVAVTDMRDWSQDALDKLKRHLAISAARAAGAVSGSYQDRGG